MDPGASRASRLSIQAAFFLIFACFSIQTLRAAEPSTQPILRVETGMHTAAIRRISVDAANRYLVTTSDDKTARIWALPSGKLLQVLRPPVGAGSEGRLFGVAISPDGGTVACGGIIGSEWGQSFSIYLFDRKSGRLRQRITGLPTAAIDLAFSTDGQYLAATLYGASGVRIYRTSDYTLAAQDEAYGDSSYSADFDRQGRLVTTSDDGFVRLYDASFQLAAKKKAPDGTKPLCARFSPDGSKIAVGFSDSPKVNVLSGTDLSLLYAPDTTGASNDDFGSVAWSDDGRFLYAGGSRDEGAGASPIRGWTEGGKGAAKDLPAADNTIMNLRSLRGGGVAFGAADPAFGAFDTTDHRTLFRGAAIADYRDNLKGFRLSPDGRTVGFAYEQWGKSPARFGIGSRLLETAGAGGDTLQPPITGTNAFNVTDWENTTAPKLNGQPLKLEPSESSRCLAVAPDRSAFLLGTEAYLRLFDPQGDERWKVPAPGAAWAVNINGNGKLAVAAFGDGTIRWYRMTDGKELLAFFPHGDRKRWVLWTPSGYYDCSPGGEDLIGWHLNNGKDKAADFFPVSRFRDRFYRPDIVAKVLETQDEAEAVRVADEEAGRKSQPVVQVEKALPPVIRIIAPAESAKMTAQEVTVKYALRSSPGAPVTTVKALIDGRPAPKQRDLQEVPDTGNDPQKEAMGELKVTLPEKDCTLSLIAENKNAASVPATVQLKWAGTAPAPVEDLMKPKLYVLAVGVSRYHDDAAPNLEFPAKDAKDFTEAMTAQKGGLYRDVEVKLLTNDEANRSNILDGLDWLQKQTTSRDVAMLLLSGHGTNDPNGNYYFIPSDFNHEKLRSTDVPFSEIKNTLEEIAGKALFFVDSCHSGNATGRRTKGLGTDITGVVNDLSSAENGTVVFSASTGSEVAQEDPAWGNGAFTKAVLEGIGGKADVNHSGRITVAMLNFYITERVKALTNGTQHPTTQIPPSVPDFPFAVPR
jgi:WD40 repeat protein